MNEHEYKNQEELKGLANDLFTLFNLKNDHDFIHLNQNEISELCICVKYLIFDNDALRRENQMLRQLWENSRDEIEEEDDDGKKTRETLGLDD